jgi:hypothetical protein
LHTTTHQVVFVRAYPVPPTPATSGTPATFHTHAADTAFHDFETDGERLARDIAERIAGLERDGFEIQHVTPVLSGTYRSQMDADKTRAYGWGYGFARTAGMLIVARNRLG